MGTIAGIIATAALSHLVGMALEGTRARLDARRNAPSTSDALGEWLEENAQAAPPGVNWNPPARTPPPPAPPPPPPKKGRPRQTPRTPRRSSRSKS